MTMPREAVPPTREWADPHVVGRRSPVARAAAPVSGVVLSLLATVQALRLAEWQPGVVPAPPSGGTSMTLATTAPVNVAALQQFAAASPPSER
ncbi:MAG TPA: hypothetical protein VH915_09960 [Pedococcus sp.]